MSTNKLDDDPYQDDVIPPQLAIKAMRDSGYKNTAFALAELIDNSVQANANQVDVFCVEAPQLVGERRVRRITEIGVLDNGVGMSGEVLRLALQFGNGTHLIDRKGIGRFGMGLPNASISQCRRLDVWTWQTGPDNALHTYLDVQEVEKGTQRQVPTPKPDPLPERWRYLAEDIGVSGTLVLWSDFEAHRLTWKSARATLRHTCDLSGRMYRKFIHDGYLTIRMNTVEEDEIQEAYEASVNDPLYLMVPSTTPPPYDQVPMFQPYGEEAHIPIPFGEQNYNVVVRASFAKDDTWPENGGDRGRTLYGKHAAKNIGVSIVRAGRELELDDSWVNNYDPTERWWGIEVEFPPVLDEVFGVTNNKQAATRFTHMAQFDWKAEAEEGESLFDFKSRLEDEGDPRYYLLDVVNYIHKTITQLREEVKRQGSGRRTDGKRHEDTSVADRASDKYRKRAQSGYKTENDNRSINEEEVYNDLVSRRRIPERPAREIAEAVSRRGRKIIFVEADSDTPAFFQVEHAGGVTEIVINRRHPAYDKLVKVMDPDLSFSSSQELVERLDNASDMFRMLLAAWARYEEEDIYSQDKISQMRYEWGKMARAFLSEDD